MRTEIFSRPLLFTSLLLLSSGLASADSVKSDTEVPSTSSMPAAADTPSNGSLTIKQHLIKWMLSDEMFVEKAAIGSRAEIELSKLAIQKSQSSQVIDLAKNMITDHMAADTKLTDIAKNSNLSIPGQLDLAHLDDIDRLKNLSATQFDTAYIDMMQKDHENAVSLFAAAAVDEHLNPQLRKFAQQTLPTLRLHQEHANSLGMSATSSQ